ncbi:MAG: DNA topoisomerase 4 subunit A [Acidimicrobiia bacterium]|nr:DNA topoisomerase 4 subunit A [Acidimicrobiia bacterium]
MPDQQELLPYARDVIDVSVADEMSESFLAYSLSVITSRAIPDVRDGLKPVQRRILYSMLQMGIRPDAPHRKCARVVGDTMARFHPHGDQAIYEALVRMGQSFSRSLTLIDPHGNFGSLDDPPAAYRYTECRLTEAAMEMVGEITEDTVEFRPTYDGEDEEPVYLPGLIPNLLVNGTSGIAVGMATNMATNNLEEVFRAIELVMTKRRPKPTIDELLAVLPGPDFPSGGTVIDEGIREAYETGRGSIRCRATADVEQRTPRSQSIVVTELPYLVGPEKVVGRIKELIVSDKVQGIADVKNLSDRKSGLRIQIDCKPDVNAQAVLGELYRLTPLEETFGVNNVVLVDGAPTTIGIRDLCQHYVTHRLDIVVRRTNYRLERARDRLHIVEGLIVALDNIDVVVSIIRGSADVAEARERLCAELDLSEIQATHILDMQLRRLTALEKQKIIDERDDLLTSIDEYLALLGSEKRQRRVVLDELAGAVQRYGRPRRTRIVGVDDIPVFEPVATIDTTHVTDESCVVTLSSSGSVGRAPTEGAKRATPGRHDVLVASTLTSTSSTVFGITSAGRAVSTLAAELGEVAGRSRGSNAAHVFGTVGGEELLTIVAPGREHLVLVTALGVAKRLSPDELAATGSGKAVIALKDGDTLAAAFVCPDDVDIAIVASDAQVLRTTSGGVSVQGRGAAGVAGMKLRGDAAVIAAGPALPGSIVVSVTDLGTAKVTPLDELDTKGRGGGGVRLTRFTDESALALAWVGSPQSLMAVMSTDHDAGKADPTPVPFPLEPTRRDLVSVATERRILGVGPARW